MSELGPEGRALLRAAHGVDDDEMLAARERLRGPLGKRLGAAAMGVTTAAVATTAHAGGALGVGLAMKAVIALAAIGLVVGGVTMSRRPVVVANAPAATATPELEGVATSAPSEVTIPVVTAPIATATPALAPTPTPKVVAPKVAPPSVSAPVSLEAEMSALRRVNDALVVGNATHALAILDATPSSGTFGEERTGLRLLAQCALGASGARDAATKFLGAHPSSPLGARLRSTCSIP